MSTPQEKAIELVDKYRVILMSEDTDCGNEILCTKIAKESALIAVIEILDFQHSLFMTKKTLSYKYWQQVKQEIEKL